MNKGALAVLAEAALKPHMPAHAPPPGAAPYDVVLHGLTMWCGALGAGIQGPELAPAVFRARAWLFLRGER